MATKKTAVYFPVASNDATSIKSAEIIMNYGYNGYGIYLALQQRLVSTPARKIELSLIKVLAYEMHTTINELQPIIDNYFDKIDNSFYSIELNERMVYFDDKYNKASEGGKKAANNLSDEERKERAKKAAQSRWSNENKVETNLTPDTNNANYLALNTNSLSIHLASDANNRIEENRIEEKRKEESNPSDCAHPSGELKNLDNVDSTSISLTKYLNSLQLDNKDIITFNEFYNNLQLDSDKISEFNKVQSILFDKYGILFNKLMTTSKNFAAIFQYTLKYGDINEKILNYIKSNINL